jgi:hypothetical protein
VVPISRIPHAFAELERAGRFDYWGAPYDSLTDEARTQLMPARTRQVLWWDHVIEWDRTVQDVLAFEGGGRLRPGLVPFAGNGVGVRTLLGAMQPVQFNDDAMSRDVLLRAYDRSVSFYQELAEVEGLTEYSLQLQQVIAARDHARDTKADG